MTDPEPAVSPEERAAAARDARKLLASKSRESRCVCTDPSFVAVAGHERRCPLFGKNQPAPGAPGVGGGDAYETD